MKKRIPMKKIFLKNVRGKKNEKKRRTETFFENQKIVFIITLFAVLICYFHHAVSTNIGIDTEQYIMGDYGKEWIIGGLGRFGYYYSIMAINLGHYNPYVNGVAFLILFSAAILLWAFVFDLIIGEKKKYHYILFTMIFLTSPLWAAHFYFSLQQGAIALALLIQAVTFWMLFDVLLNSGKNSKTKNILELLVSVVCAWYAIGTYQAFPGLHISEAAACLLLLYDRMVDQDSSVKVHKEFWKKTGIVILQFLISYALYAGICKWMNWGTSDYLQLKWGKMPVKKVIYKLWKDFENILLGREAYAGWVILISVCLCIILIIKNFRDKKSVWLKLDYLLLLIGNIISMVILNIVIGAVPADRARLPVAFSAAFLGMYTLGKCIEILKGAKFQKGLVILAGIGIAVSVWTQLGRCQRLFYTDDICNMQEYEVGQDIVKEIESLGGDSQAKLIFLGKWDALLNDSCLKQGVIGVSSFNWDYYKKKPASGTRRSTLYLRAAFGKMYEIVSDEQQQAAAIQLAANAPSYPQEGYIQKMDDIFVIKLCDYEN